MTVSSRYDDLIRKAAHKHLGSPGPDWRWLKAQFHCESAMDPDAVSPVGARGVAQFMPGTWDDMQRQVFRGETRDIHDPEASIYAGAYYMAWLTCQWNAPRPSIDRWLLAVASYNAGLGNLLKAQELAGGVNDFASIIARLEDVTGSDDAPETRNYCKRICETFYGLVLGY